MLCVFSSAAYARLPDAALRITLTDVVAEQSADPLRVPLDGRADATVLDVRISAQTRAEGPARVIGVHLQDLRGGDRALDLDVTLPLDLTGWTWHHDIRQSERIDAASELAERQYPLIVVTPEGGGEGIAMAIEPHQPVVYELRGGSEGLTLHAQLGLTPAGVGDLRSQAHVRLYLFPVDGALGFRGALATYYDLFPDAFERLAMDEGQWLFAFENTKLPNPAHYAYHEGGPAGWQYDEEHGIGTYPYTEVSSRTIHMHRLPEDRQDAVTAFEEYRQRQELSAAEWGMRGATVDTSVARSGSRSLRCEKDDPQQWVGAVQDVMVRQAEPEPVTISGWLRAQDVSGENQRELSLYGDVQLASGEWLFGQIAGFEPGTYDWRRATCTVESEQPIRMVRLHCLFRHGHTGTVWFDDISVTTASRPDENLVQNASFEEAGTNRDVAAIDAYHVEAADGHPVFFIRTDLSADVKPETPMKLLRFCLSPSPYLQRPRSGLPREGAPVPPGPATIEKYRRMIKGIPALDGAYIDSVSGWASRELDFRREHFHTVRHSFTYDPHSKRVVAPGKHYTYDFLKELGEALHPQDRWVFTNIHNTMDTFLLYTVSDVPGIESSITNHERFSYIRSASYHKPAVLLNFLNLLGFDERSKHDYHWRMAVLYGLYPSIGRRCDEAYELYGDLYRRFMPSLKRISAAGWEPVTHARMEPAGPAIERFGNSTSGLFFTIYNEAESDYEGSLTIDARAFGLIRDTLVGCDTTTGSTTPVEQAEGQARVELTLPPGEVAVMQVGTPTQVGQTTRAELDEVVTHLRRLESELPEERADRVRDLRGRVIGMHGTGPEELTADAVRDLVALYNDESIQGRAWTGETPGQALLRAMLLAARIEAAHHAPVDIAVSGTPVSGEESRVELHSGGEAVAEAVFLLHDAEGLQVVETDFTWPQEGHGPGLVDVIAIGVGDRPGAVRRTHRLRPAVEVRLETEEPWAMAAERILTARCHNNSSKLRHMRLRVESPGEGWEMTPAQWRSVDVPAHGSMEAEFRVRAPEGTVRMVPMRVVAEAGPERIGAEAMALCGRPAELAENLARSPGVTVSVDSSYPGGYRPEPLNDGLLWPENVHWTKHAWASAESGKDHWVEFAWPEPVDISRVIIYWNVENERVFTGREVIVEVLRDDGWAPVAEAQPQPGEAATAIVLSPIHTERLRIMQPAGMGSEHRPNLMWVTEVQVG
ncbi:MAG: hypothetical protein U9R79_11145 [Armatimonadota bacterium]|nr:hypothetical protein [Armatimonadota bacterium]